MTASPNAPCWNNWEPCWRIVPAEGGPERSGDCAKSGAETNRIRMAAAIKSRLRRTSKPGSGLDSPAVLNLRRLLNVHCESYVIVLILMLTKPERPDAVE